MAGAKINTKSKGKDDKRNKNINSTNEESEDHDFSLLRKPVLTSITGFAQARKIFDFATEELKSLLCNECDLLYECKVCRNIFRSLANFISHKRVYCKEKFNSSVHSHFVNNNSAANEILKIKQMEAAYQESLRITELDSNKNEDRIPLTKDITGIMEKLTKIKGRYSFDEQQVTLQKIPNSSVAVFQSHCEENKFDNMLAQVHELDNMISQDNAVLQSDGTCNIQSSLNADRIEDSDNVIQISDDEDSDEGRIPKCKICDMQFSTQKTLKFHMKYKHLESRLVYPCPDCFEIFSTSWSVYRHLFKVHRKSAAQIRRLRESIQAKAFRMNNPPAFYEKKKNSKPLTPQKISEEERLDQENQAWMDNMEGDGELPRCGGCGRTFERRAALAAHTHTCQPRSRALALARRPDAKRIEIQIRKDYNKGPQANPLLKDATENKQVNEESEDAAKPRPEKNPEVIQKSFRLMDDKNRPEETLSQSTLNQTPNDNETIEGAPVQKMPEPRNNVLEEATMDILDERSSIGVDSSEKGVQTQMEKKAKLRLPFAHQAEKSNLAAFKQRMQGEIDLDKLLCKKCYLRHDKLLDLYDHMATHYKWMRYACKLCNFKHYEFEKLPEHVKVVHKLKGDSDFYFSTVKAVDGVEALELAEPAEENEANEESPESRRPSRCSSDSSRLSDDSSSSSTRVEGSRKRKMYQNRSMAKRKKESNVNDETENNKESEVSTDRPANNIGDRESQSNVKPIEENSSDMDDIEDKAKRSNIDETSSVASRRPVRKRTKPLNEDFEYDLSNLLKMEAQGYRDSQVVTTTKKETTQTKKKLLQELQSNYETINKEHIGALTLLSKKAVDVAAAEFKTNNFSAPIFNVQKEHRIPNIFARPMVPKVSRGDKMSPRKDPTEITEEAVKDGPSSNRVPKIQDTVPIKETKNDKASAEENISNPSKEDVTPAINNHGSTENTESNETVKSKLKIPAVVPLKFRRQSLELMKNPIINKNISDFSKAGMKTKILLIKPINRNKDGVSVNAPLKFQTIKLKEPNKGTTSKEEKSNDQIVVVKVPKVERTAAKNVPDNNSLNEQRLVTANRPDAVKDVEAKIVSDNRIKPIQSSNNTTQKSNVIDNDKMNTSSSSTCVDQINAKNSNNTESLSSHAEMLEPANDIDKDGCGILISSVKSIAMDVDKLDKSIPEPIVGETNSNNELTNSISTSCVQESSVIQKPTCDLVGPNPEPCTSSNDAITVQETANMHAAVVLSSPPT